MKLAVANLPFGVATFLLAFIANACLVAQDIAWRHDVQQALREAQSVDKLVWLHIGADWCQPCRSLETFVFRNPNLVREANTQVIPVKIDFDHAAHWVEKFQVQSIPYDVLMDANGAPVIRRNSPQAVDDFLAMFRAAREAHRATNPHARPPINDQTPIVATEAGHTLSPSRLTTVSNQVSQSLASDASSPSQEIMVNSLRKKPAEQLVVNPFFGNAGREENGQSHIEPTGGANSAPMEVGPMSAVEAMPVCRNSANTGSIALNGDCPVTLLLENRWVAGSEEFGCLHRGQIYLFASEAYLEMFWNDPDRFSPVLAGFDPVIYHDTGKLVPGSKVNGVFAYVDGNQQIVLFRDESTRSQFRADPTRYLETAQRAAR